MNHKVIDVRKVITSNVSGYLGTFKHVFLKSTDHQTYIFFFGDNLYLEREIKHLKRNGIVTSHWHLKNKEDEVIVTLIVKPFTVNNDGRYEFTFPNEPMHIELDYFDGKTYYFLKEIGEREFLIGLLSHQLLDAIDHSLYYDLNGVYFNHIVTNNYMHTIDRFKMREKVLTTNDEMAINYLRYIRELDEAMEKQTITIEECLK